MYAIIIIFIITMLLMLLALVYTFGQASMSNGSYFMGITLAKEHREHEEVQAIAKEYLMKNRRINFIGFLTIFIVLLFIDYTSLMLIYLFVWFFTLIFVSEKQLKRSAWKLYNLKKKYGWLTGKANIKRVDTTVSSMNKLLPVSAAWLIPAIALGIYSVYYSTLPVFDKSGNIKLLSLIYALCGFMFVVLYYAVTKARNKVYCKDSKINLKVNRAIKYEWSRCMIFHAYGAVIFALIMALSDKADNNIIFEIVCFSMVFFGPFVVMYITWQNIKKVKELAFLSDNPSNHNNNNANNYINQSDKANNPENDFLLYDDDDIYWLTDTYNPNDGRLQEKRVGIGFTFNMGKMGTYVIYGIIMLFVGGMSLFMLKFDLADITLEVHDNNGIETIYVKAADMGYHFESEDIESVTMLEKIPKMSKNSGYDGSNFYFGSFSVNGYDNQCEVYISLRNPQVILIKTTDKTILVNHKDTDKTAQMYNLLLDIIE